jgi:bifunctional non-homologous end joining protein LigD
MKKAVRTNKVFVDWSQNDQHKTTISVYALRARERPTVSTPVSWEEVEQALKKKDASSLVFEAKDVLARVQKTGDLFEPVQKLKQKLPELSGLAGGSGSEKEDKKKISVPTGARSSPTKKTAATTNPKAKSKTQTKRTTATAKKTTKKA